MFINYDKIAAISVNEQNINYSIDYLNYYNKYIIISDVPSTKLGVPALILSEDSNYIKIKITTDEHQYIFTIYKKHKNKCYYQTNIFSLDKYICIAFDFSCETMNFKMTKNISYLTLKFKKIKIIFLYKTTLFDLCKQVIMNTTQNINKLPLPKHVLIKFK